MIYFNFENTTPRITVEDNGNGFETFEETKRSSGNGLLNIRSRILLINGHVDFISVAGSGTKVEITVPY